MVADGLFQLSDRSEDAAPYPSSGDTGKEALDGVEPGCNNFFQAKLPLD
jgi:hypothetical protein